MNVVDLHIIKSFPVSCLVRGEDGEPKTCLYGGCTRARISSQSIKRSSRIQLK